MQQNMGFFPDIPFICLIEKLPFFRKMCHKCGPFHDVPYVCPVQNDPRTPLRMRFFFEFLIFASSLYLAYYGMYEELAKSWGPFRHMT